MRFRLRLKNGKTHEFTLPDNVEVHRDIMWIPKEAKKDKMTRFIVIPDDVESIELIEE
jgi:hypothetical protein